MAIPYLEASPSTKNEPRQGRNVEIIAPFLIKNFLHVYMCVCSWRMHPAKGVFQVERAAGLIMESALYACVCMSVCIYAYTLTVKTRRGKC